jgi:DNA-3-methyladenine glycosylase II
MPELSPTQEITTESIPTLVAQLTGSSKVMRSIVSRYGMPPAWRREPGFASLVYAIIEQQVSLASARAVYERLVAAVGELTAERFMALSAEELRALGFSRQKIEYCRGLAEQIVSARLNLAELDTAPDEVIRETLTAIRGIGSWTADVYLLHSLGRPDIWPVGDLALQVAIQEELRLLERPTQSQVAELGEQWRPWRSVAARVFWHGYLCRRGVREVT